MHYKYLLNRAPFALTLLQTKIYSSASLDGIPHLWIIFNNPELESSSLELVHSSCQSYIQWINVNRDRISTELGQKTCSPEHFAAKSLLIPVLWPCMQSVYAHDKLV